MIGAALLLRGLTNMEVKRLTGIDAGRRAVEVQKTINVAAPIEWVYQLWTNYENFPRFMSNVREVRDTGNGLSHWVISGPAGVSIEWDAVVTRKIPNEIFAWKSIEGASVENSGLVRFDRNEDGSTRVQVRLSYNPPAGAIGHTVAKLFGADPKTQMDDDLMRMKSFIETGVQPADATDRGQRIHKATAS
jgi:uncharacterized membrane protein